MTTAHLDAALALTRLRRRLPDPRTRRMLRERADISQAVLAAAIGVERATVSRWESGDREPEGQYLQSYIEALDRLAREAI